MMVNEHTWRSVADEQEPPLTEEEWDLFEAVCQDADTDGTLMDHLIKNNPEPEMSKTTDDYSDLVADVVASRRFKKRDIELWKEFKKENKND